MRKFLHKMVDFICDISDQIYFFFVHSFDAIVCYFRKPKYKLYNCVRSCWVKPRIKTICHIYKDYKYNNIYYTLSDGISYSEGLLDFYQRKINE